MALSSYGIDSNIWRPQPIFETTIRSASQLKEFNNSGGIAVFIDVMRSEEPHIAISGSQSQDLSFWETQTRSGFVTKPKFSAGLLTIRFVTDGLIVYTCHNGEISATPAIATLTGFDELREVRALGAVSAVSATIAVTSLALANQALSGEEYHGVPPLEPIAEMATQGMPALFCTIRAVQRRLQGLDSGADLVLPLLQEVMCYQLLSAWPRQIKPDSKESPDSASRQLRQAIEYIEANLSTAMRLADISAACGMSVRSLQSKFKKEVGQTPIQFIIERRLTRSHQDLLSQETRHRSVSEIAHSWGFVHMSDFGQRYRRLYGCTPSKTQQDARRIK